MGLWWSTGQLAHCPLHTWRSMSCAGLITPTKKTCKPPSINWPKTCIFTYQHPDNLRSLMSVALGPSSWLIFRALHSLEHSSVTELENKLTSANRFINYEHAQNIHPSFKYSRSKDLAVFYLRNLKHLSHKLCLEELLQLLSRQKSLACSFYRYSLQAKKTCLVIATKDTSQFL